MKTAASTHDQIDVWLILIGVIVANSAGVATMLDLMCFGLAPVT
jgi:hypothetical protein